MKEIEYIHYGSKKFDKNKFEEIMNRPDGVLKPFGGLWASRIDAEYGWKEWTQEQEFRLDKYSKDNYFKFKLKDNARVLVLRSSKQLEKLPQVKEIELENGMVVPIPDFGQIVLDFEKLKEEYDAIELLMSEEDNTGYEDIFDGLYWKLYGWDCDSILVMNKDIIEVIGND